MTATPPWWRWSRTFSGRISTPSRKRRDISGLLQDFGLTHEALGYAVSKSRSHVGNTIRLLRLPDPIKAVVRSGSLSSGHARALLNYPNPEALVDQILKQGMSVRQTEMLVAKKIAARGVVATTSGGKAGCRRYGAPGERCPRLSGEHHHQPEGRRRTQHSVRRSLSTRGIGRSPDRRPCDDSALRCEASRVRRPGSHQLAVQEP